MTLRKPCSTLSLTFLFLIPTFICWAQPSESLRKLYAQEKNKSKKAYLAGNIALTFTNVDPDSLKSYVNKIPTNNAKDPLIEAILLKVEIAQIINFDGKLNNLKKLNRARQLFKELNYPEELDYLNVAEAQYYGVKNDFFKSSNLFVTAYETIRAKWEKEPNSWLKRENYTLVLNYLGFHYYRMGEFDKAVQMNDEILKTVNKIKNPSDYAMVLGNNASVLIHARKFAEAIPYLNKSREVQQSFKLVDLYAWNSYSLAVVYSSIGKKDQALEYLLEAENYTTKHGLNNVSLSLMSSLKGQIFITQGKTVEALKCLEYAEKNQDYYFTLKAKEQLNIHIYLCYKKLNNLKNSLLYLEKSKLLSDSLNTSSIEKMKEFRSKFYDLENLKIKKDLTNASKEKILTLENNNAINTRNILLIGLLVLLSAVLFLIYFSRKLSKSNSQNQDYTAQIKTSLKEKEVMIKEIHHRVKNNFQIISSLLNIQSNKLNDLTQIAPLRDAQNRVLSMSLVHQKLYSQNSDFENIEMHSYLQELCNHYQSLFELSDAKFHLTLITNSISIDLQRAVPLGLMTNEIITNAFKYGKSSDGHLSLTIVLNKTENNTLLLHVCDKGVGFSPNKSSFEESMGQELIEILSEQIDGKLSQYNENGAHVVLEF